MTNTMFRPEVRNRNNEFANVMNHLFQKPLHHTSNDARLSFTPALANIQQEDDRFIIQMAVPGFAKEDITLTIEDQKIIVRGKKQVDESKKFLRKEYGFSSFERIFTFSKDIDSQSIEASTSEGILSIILYKIPQKAPLSIEVK